MKASERLAKLRDLQVPEAQAMDLVKSAISAGEVENDLEQGPTIDVKKLEGILEELRKSQATTIEPIIAHESLDMKAILDATVSEVRSETTQLSKALVSHRSDLTYLLGEMVSELAVHLTSLDQRGAEIAKSLGGKSAPVPQSVLGAVTSAPSPHDQLTPGASPDDVVRLRKSLVGKLTAELRAGVSDDNRRLELAGALANAASTNDPAAFAKSVGISL